MTELPPHGTEAVIIVSGEGGRLNQDKVREAAEFLSPLSLRKYPVPTIAGYAWHLGARHPSVHRNQERPAKGVGRRARVCRVADGLKSPRHQRALPSPAMAAQAVNGPGRPRPTSRA